jgi:uncharacterized protein
MSEYIEQTTRTKLKRLPKRGHFERASVYKILDEAFICHVGFCVNGQPFVIPTSFARIGDRLVIHGSAASRMMRSLSEEIDICVTVTLVDGLVLARSAFHHSMNYRSVVVFGKAKIVSDEQEKYEALKAFTEHIVPNRWAEIRPPTALELKATTVLSVSLSEASAKIRAGGPVDDEEDYEMNVWAGVLPLQIVAGEPVKDDLLQANAAVPEYLKSYNRG